MRLGPIVVALAVLWPMAEATAATERGTASIYADHFDGRRTASGEVFRQSATTAAHRRLPFGSKIKVTNLRNGRSVVVTVNDRGPHGNKKRVLDLSKAAARQLALAGTEQVEVEVVKTR
jgi:rare lipoprotein A